MASGPSIPKEKKKKRSSDKSARSNIVSVTTLIKYLAILFIIYSCLLLAYSKRQGVVLIGFTQEHQCGADATSKAVEREIGQMVNVFLGQDQIRV